MQARTKYLIAILVTAGVIVAFVAGGGRWYVQACLPLYAKSIELLAPQWRIDALTITQTRLDNIVKLDITPVRDYHVGLGTLRKGYTLTSTTLTGHAIIHPIIILSLLLPWILLRWRSRWYGLLMIVPLLVLVEMLDIPVVLVGALQDLIYANVGPDLSPPWVVTAMTGLNGGGRLALAIAAALSVIAVTRGMEQHYAEKPVDR